MGSLFTIQSEFRCEIVRPLSEGGRGMVYEAEQHGARGFVKPLAIKVISGRFASQPTFIENFIDAPRNQIEDRASAAPPATAP